MQPDLRIGSAPWPLKPAPPLPHWRCPPFGQLLCLVGMNALARHVASAASCSESLVADPATALAAAPMKVCADDANSSRVLPSPRTKRSYSDTESLVLSFFLIPRIPALSAVSAVAASTLIPRSHRGICVMPLPGLYLPP
jgi:hypothetical protein